MNTVNPAIRPVPAGGALSVSARLRAYGQEIRCEFLSLLRTMSFSLPTLLFPPMFYLLFAVLMPMGRSGAWQAGHYLLATYTVFGVMTPKPNSPGAITPKTV